MTRLRSTWLAGTAALILMLALTGAVLGVSVQNSAGPVPESATDPLVASTWEDLDGNGIDDDCQDAVTPDPAAALAADQAVDANADGTVSVDEAAQSDRIGGSKCNHGGYVSGVAQATDENDDEATVPEANDTCVATVISPFVAEAFPGPGAFGAYVSSIARSDAVGGTNCNHGGAVSTAVAAAKAVAQAAKAAEKAERAAAKAAEKAERAAAKAERAAAKAAAKAEREAARDARKAANPGGGNGG